MAGMGRDSQRAAVMISRSRASTARLSAAICWRYSKSRLAEREFSTIKVALSASSNSRAAAVSSMLAIIPAAKSGPKGECWSPSGDLRYGFGQARPSMIAISWVASATSRAAGSDAF